MRCVARKGVYLEDWRTNGCDYLTCLVEKTNNNPYLKSLLAMALYCIGLGNVMHIAQSLLFPIVIHQNKSVCLQCQGETIGNNCRQNTDRCIEIYPVLDLLAIYFEILVSIPIIQRFDKDIEPTWSVISIVNSPYDLKPLMCLRREILTSRVLGRERPISVLLSLGYLKSPIINQPFIASHLVSSQRISYPSLTPHSNPKYKKIGCWGMKLTSTSIGLAA